jgi:hypothetical protein
MGSRIVNGKPAPITPWKGSWAEQEQARRAAGKPLDLNGRLSTDGQWPLGFRPTVLPKGGR